MDRGGFSSVGKAPREGSKQNASGVEIKYEGVYVYNPQYTSMAYTEAN
jgi:hypothetical protein